MIFRVYRYLSEALSVYEARTGNIMVRCFSKLGPESFENVKAAVLHVISFLRPPFIAYYLVTVQRLEKGDLYSMLPNIYCSNFCHCHVSRAD